MPTLNPLQASFVARYLGVTLQQAPVAEAPADLASDFEALRSPLPAQIAAMDDQQMAARLEQDLRAADALAASGAYVPALERLDQITRDLSDARGRARVQSAAAEIPRGKVGELVKALESDIVLVNVQVLRAIQGLGALQSTLRKEPDSDLHAIADRIDVLTDDLPRHLEATLQSFKTAIQSGDTPAASAAQRSAQQQIDDAVAYLDRNRTELTLCEQNPFGLPLEIVQPLSGAIKQIRASVDRL